MSEIARVLRPGGHVVIRNTTREAIDDLAYFAFFPESREVERRRLPSRAALRAAFAAHAFADVAHRVVRQPFAADHDEYYRKISRRALSSMRLISDAAFARGLAAFERFCRAAPPGPVVEPVDVFVFRRA